MELSEKIHINIIKQCWIHFVVFRINSNFKQINCNRRDRVVSCCEYNSNDFYLRTYYHILTVVLIYRNSEKIRIGLRIYREFSMVKIYYILNVGYISL